VSDYACRDCAAGQTGAQVFSGLDQIMKRVVDNRPVLDQLVDHGANLARVRLVRLSRRALPMECQIG
jgi:hypothetical protein